MCNELIALRYHHPRRLDSQDGKLVRKLPWTPFGLMTGPGASPCGQVNELAVYVLFQEGPFELKLRALRLVESPPDADALTRPALPSHPAATLEDAQAYLSQAINSGASVFNKVRTLPSPTLSSKPRINKQLGRGGKLDQYE